MTQTYRNDVFTAAEKKELKRLEAKIVKHDSRICFGITYFADEADAEAYGALVRKRGDTYNGGYMHGVPCGRDRSWDHDDKVTGRRRYAVTEG